MLKFTQETEYLEQRIAATPLNEFAVPHLIVDDIFTESLIERINENWPTYADGFFPEVAGNHILQMFRRNYGKVPAGRREFWESFNEVVWRNLISATAEAFAEPATAVFGDLYYKHLSLEHPLTLMQADPTYPGHSMHHHFYHAPHWAFTMLLYVDPDDRYSRGTELHRLMARDGSDNEKTAYQTRDLNWRTEVAMDSFHWEDRNKPDRKYQAQESKYKPNRLFVFMDGALALHSVPFDNPDHTPNPERARDGGRYARRRILRSHVKVHQIPFYKKYSAGLPKPIVHDRYTRIMAPNAVLSPDDQVYRDTVIRPFFAERMAAYGRAAAALETRSVRVAQSLPDGFFMPPRYSNRFMWQLIQRTP